MDLRRFDVFPKLDNEFRVGTTSGGILSLLSIIMTVILSYSEISAYLNPPIRQKLIVDSIRPTAGDGRTISSASQPRLDVYLNITFPHTPCYLMHFDVIDSVTQLPLPLEHVNSTFTRLSQKSEKLGVFPISSMLQTDPLEECGSCYESDAKCCKNCQEVFDAYRQKGLQPPLLSSISQCSSLISKFKEMDEEGCNIDAKFRAVRVASEFHVSPGLSWNSEGWHVHDLRTFDKNFSLLNLTHKIERIQFINSNKPMPLDGFNNIQEHQKSWRVVYTADILDGNFSASRYAMYDPKSFSPGVVFKYDVSPISAITYFDREPMLHLCTRLLTVIGGVLGLFRLIDAVLFYATKNKKQDQIE